MYIISLTYKKPIQEVEALLQAHVEFPDKCYARHKFIFSGRKNPRTGGIILARDLSRTELEELLCEDPFHQNQVADYEITEVIPTKYDEAFSCFV